VKEKKMVRMKSKKQAKPLTPQQRKTRAFRRFVANTAVAGIVAPSPVTAVLTGVAAAKATRMYMDNREANRKARQARVLRRLAAPEVSGPEPLIPGTSRKPAHREKLVTRRAEEAGKPKRGKIW